MARRKVGTLRACGGDVVVVSPVFCPGLARMKGVRRIERRYRKSDLRGALLVVAATDSVDVNERVRRDAEGLGTLVNVVDQPEASSFVVPATAECGDITVTVSTGGGSPALARGLREHLEGDVLPLFAEHLALVKALRSRVLASGLSAAARRTLFRRMASDEVRGVLEAHGAEMAVEVLDRLLCDAIGQ